MSVTSSVPDNSCGYHLVPLALAWDMGAYDWPRRALNKRCAFWGISCLGWEYRLVQGVERADRELLDAAGEGDGLLHVASGGVGDGRSGPVTILIAVDGAFQAVCGVRAHAPAV